MQKYTCDRIFEEEFIRTLACEVNERFECMLSSRGVVLEYDVAVFVGSKLLFIFN